KAMQSSIVSTALPSCPLLLSRRHLRRRRRALLTPPALAHAFQNAVMELALTLELETVGQRRVADRYDTDDAPILNHRKVSKAPLMHPQWGIAESLLGRRGDGVLRHHRRNCRGLWRAIPADDAGHDIPLGEDAHQLTLVHDGKSAD